MCVFVYLCIYVSMFISVLLTTHRYAAEALVSENIQKHLSQVSREGEQILKNVGVTALTDVLYNISTTGSGTQVSLITSPAAAPPAAMAQTAAAHAVAASEADVATAQAASRSRAGCERPGALCWRG